MVSDVRVRVLTDDGELELTEHVLGVQVSDGVGQEALPQGSVTLPRYRTLSGRSRRPYTALVRVGDLVTIEAYAWTGSRGGWEPLLHGPVIAVADTEAVSDGLQATVQLTVASMAHILAQDAVRQWMYLGSVEGWQPVQSRLTTAEMSGVPAEVAFRYLTRVAFHNAMYRHQGRSLGDLVHLDFDGLEAVGPLFTELTAAEGTHLEIISRILDYPFHELYVTTAKAGELRGRWRHRASSAPGDEEGATTVRWRAAPYPYADPGGRGVLTAWQALPLHTLDHDLHLVRGQSRARTDTAVRNFFMAYPALSFSDDQFLFGLGAVVAHRASIQRFGYRPMNIRTHLVLNDGLDRSTVADFMFALTYRLAGQWNRLHEMMSGTLQAPFYPWIRPGERVRAPSLWDAEELAEYHVRGRQLTWQPERGGSMSLAVERGLPVGVYRDADWFVQGLEPVRVGSDIYARPFARRETR